MDVSLAVILGLFLIVFTLLVRTRGASGVRTSSVYTVRTFRMVLPLIALGMVMAGFVNVVLPPGVIARWMGSDSGVLGVVIGMVAGIIMPGGPYITFPLAVAVHKGGAGIGPMAAFLTAWAVIPINRTVIWEAPFLGVTFTTVRVLASLSFPIVAGLLTPPLYHLFT